MMMTQDIGKETMVLDMLHHPGWVRDGPHLVAAGTLEPNRDWAADAIFFSPWAI